MIFTPYDDEIKVINNIHKHNNNEYTLLRLTPTMIKKNNIDANALFRDLLFNKNIVDYEDLANGGKNGVLTNALFLCNDMQLEIKMNFYRVTNTRGDRRFSIYGINKLLSNRKINIGDLLYLTVAGDQNPKVVIINVTNNIPTESELKQVFGIDDIADSASRLIPLVKKIAQEGYHKNSKGIGKFSPKDAGDTLESLLGIKTNNSPDADFEGKIEIKTKSAKTLDTLFTLRPQFDGTTIAKYEMKDRSRVSAFARYYGYESDKHLGFKSLYITIGSKEAPQNSHGFYLNVNEEERKIELWGKDPNSNKLEITAYWNFSDLQNELYRKHPATLWVKVNQRMMGETAEFNYTEAELSRSPQFTTFLALVKSGGITYDWRGYISPEGAYKGKNHGNAWRIRGKYRSYLFGNIEKIDLLE
ncbi:MvaI/BcnI family restriction endonuclease [Bacillus pumilus]|uniref:MvaI/BcnI family restriction endonuclease n=1 Tax=Bacillus pumilus TaxID=1408 RepID=UPI0023DB1365|nr:MvaI/BcnI family restriction endonuclease [Bacillus pumilus]MDF2002662.1 MvaI/BcnI family restriction endonuclease [Bacillus pumilus]MDF2025652.1 MvaI/BcnI family restriction endonuclease [Bacillus pumilus]MDF2027544.1 MvaI/BcnI family restriction endonuclease [Bacillus pumilus]MDF2090538.1 MvaI/BcnI family restriction endonuclease [Bacillus pumilus]